jgi:hypothetical protein
MPNSSKAKSAPATLDNTQFVKTVHKSGCFSPFILFGFYKKSQRSKIVPLPIKRNTVIKKIHPASAPGLLQNVEYKQKRDLLGILPTDVIRHVIVFAGPAASNNLRMTNKTFNEIIETVKKNTITYTESENVIAINAYLICKPQAGNRINNDSNIITSLIITSADKLIKLSFVSTVKLGKEPNVATIKMCVEKSIHPNKSYATIFEKTFDHSKDHEFYNELKRKLEKVNFISYYEYANNNGANASITILIHNTPKGPELIKDSFKFDIFENII